MTANADMPDSVSEHRHPYGPCHHTKYEGCPPCVHSAWDEGVHAARDAVAALPDLGKRIWATSDCSCMEYYCFCEHQGKAQALAAIDALRGES